METAEPQVRLTSAAYVTVKLAASLTGLTDRAIRRKIQEGKWLEGREYERRDGSVFVSMRGYDRWVQGATV